MVSGQWFVGIEFPHLARRSRSKESRFLILVPDAFRGQTLSQQLKGFESIKIGTRSSVFECDGRYDCVIMVDEEDPSYKQEQMPMYDTAPGAFDAF